MHFEELDIIIPTYNRADFLKIQLESIFNSVATWRKTVILNNASTDHTLAVINEVKNKYPTRKIEVITNDKNIGNPENFRKIQLIANNTYTAIFHDDDVIHPEYIDRVMQILRNDKSIVAVSGEGTQVYSAYNNNFYFLPNSYWEYTQSIFEQLIINRLTFCSCIYRTDIYVKVNYEYNKYGKLHDIIFMMEIGVYGKIALLHGECVR